LKFDKVACVFAARISVSTALCGTIHNPVVYIVYPSGFVSLLSSNVLLSAMLYKHCYSLGTE
jgi:hypothetical protein